MFASMSQQHVASLPASMGTAFGPTRFILAVREQRRTIRLARGLFRPTPLAQTVGSALMGGARAVIYMACLKMTIFGRGSLLHWRNVVPRRWLCQSWLLSTVTPNMTS